MNCFHKRLRRRDLAIKKRDLNRGRKQQTIYPTPNGPHCGKNGADAAWEGIKKGKGKSKLCQVGQEWGGGGPSGGPPLIVIQGERPKEVRLSGDPCGRNERQKKKKEPWGLGMRVCKFWWGPSGPENEQEARYWKNKGGDGEMEGRPKAKKKSPHPPSLTWDGE